MLIPIYDRYPHYACKQNKLFLSHDLLVNSIITFHYYPASYHLIHIPLLSQIYAHPL